MDIVYVDELFLRNAGVDYLLLLAAARLRGRAPRRGRLAAAAGLGGVYAVLAALPPLRGLGGVWGAAGMSLVLAALAYGTGPGFLKSWGCFLAMSAALGGAVLALGRAGGPGRATVLCLGLGYALLRLRPGRDKKTELREAELTLAGRSVGLTALVDTGNRLYDPLTGRAVLIADAAALSPLFVPPVPSPLPAEPTERFRRLAEHPALRGRLRLVGFSALGTERGLLVCFRPDRLRAGGEELDRLVAFSPTAMAGEEYNAIL